MHFLTNADHKTLSQLLSFPPHIVLEYIVEQRTQYGSNWLLDNQHILHIEYSAYILLYLLDINEYPRDWIHFHLATPTAPSTSTWNIFPPDIRDYFHIATNLRYIPHITNWCRENPNPDLSYYESKYRD